MSRRTFDPGIILALFCSVILVTLAGFVSVYAEGQSSRSMARLVDATVKSKSPGSVWTTLREGNVLGRSVPKKGSASYMVVVHRAFGEYRAIANVDEDGSILGIFPLGQNDGYATVKRLGVLFGRAGQASVGADTSPIDGSLELLIVDTLETITRLERSRMEALDADR